MKRNSNLDFVFTLIAVLIAIGIYLYQKPSREKFINHLQDDDYTVCTMAISEGKSYIPWPSGTGKTRLNVKFTNKDGEIIETRIQVRNSLHNMKKLKTKGTLIPIRYLKKRNTHIVLVDSCY